MKDKVKGVIYGQALGDAMGMPAELWSRRKAIEVLGEIQTFLDGPYENSVSRNYSAGQYTDDTAQAFVILDALAQTAYVPDGIYIAQRLLKWAEENDAFACNILGPTSKAALEAVRDGKDTKSISDEALSNGAAMRIAPVGVLFDSEQLRELADYVKQISAVTHSSDIAIASASLVAAAVSCGVECGDTRKAIEKALEIEEYALSLGAETFSPSMGARIKLGIEYARQYENDSVAFLEKVYEIIGAGVAASESVPAAMVVAYYAQTPDKCALLCANLGGDTDTIGAMATAICGATHGYTAISTEYVKVLESKNEINFDKYVEILMKGREVLHG